MVDYSPYPQPHMDTWWWKMGATYSCSDVDEGGPLMKLDLGALTTPHP